MALWLLLKTSNDQTLRPMTADSVTPSLDFGAGFETAPVFESAPCPMGCPRHDQPVLTGRDYLCDLPGQFFLVRCTSCGLMRLDPRPSPASIIAYYPSTYGPHQDPDTLTSAGDRVRPGWQATVRRRFDFRTQPLPPVKPGHALELGCAVGTFLDHLRDDGWVVEGLEPSQAAADRARAKGHQVETIPIEQAELFREPYDLIVAWMVLEHLHDPIAALKKLTHWADPAGWLVVSVPNAAAIEFALFKDRWYALQLPTHLYHFTPTTLAALLEKGGWRVDRIVHQRVLTNLIGSLEFLLRDAKWGSRIAPRIQRIRLNPLTNFMLYPVATLLAHVGQTGRMVAWARPIHSTSPPR
jgi:2-polyprenyl-3-methyl-5-hydroxy-6-metoxy-1,4-benzoquinol methylase